MSRTCWFTTIYLLGSLLYSKSMFAQDFGTPGSTWYYHVPNFAGSGIDYTQIQSVNDTFLAGHDCHHLKITHGFDCCFGGNNYFVYEDSGIVYYFISEVNKFFVLYNFNLHVGDTLKGYGYTLFGGLDSILSRITGVYTEIINGRSVKRFTTETGDIIEGIGSTSYLFPQFAICDPGPNGLRCFEDSNLGFFTTNKYPSCNYAIQDVSFYPNPASAVINFGEDFKPDGIEIEIFDALGREMFSKKLTTERILDLSLFAPGFYFLKVTQESHEQFFKLVKQ